MGRGRAAGGAGLAGHTAADGDGQGVAAHLAVVVGDDGVDLIRSVGHGAVHHHSDAGLAGGLRDLLTVGVPAQVLGLGVLAAQGGLEGVGAAHSALALAGDVDGGRAEDCRDVQILLEVGVGAGLAGEAVAPLDEDMALRRDSGHGDGFVGVGDGVGHRAVAGVIADAQSAAAVLVHTVAGLELFVLAGALAGRALRAAGALGLTLAGADSLRAGSGHGGAGVGDILHGAGGDVVGVGAAVLGLQGVGAEIVQHGLEAGALEVDVAAGVVVRDAVAVAALEGLGRVEEADAQLLAQIQKGHVEVVDLGLVHVGVVGVVSRDRRHRVDDDVGVGVALLDGLDEGRVVGDEVRDFHPGVVGAEGHDHTARLHHGHRLRDGVMVGILLKGNDALVERDLGADALFGAELLQGDEAVVIEADGVGIAQKKGVVQIVRAGVGGLRQQSGGGVVDLVVARQVFAGGGVCHRLRDGGGRLLAALFEEGGGDAEGQQHRQHAEDADQNGPMLHGSHGFVLLLFFSTHRFSPSRFRNGKARPPGGEPSPSALCSQRP